MKGNPKDGGPFFPTGIEKFDGPQRTVEHFTGISKREWFAGMALAGAMIADIERAKNGRIIRNGEADLADTCFRIADAMLLESTKPSKEVEWK